MKSSVSDRLEELCCNRKDSHVFSHPDSGSPMAGVCRGRLTSPSGPIVMISICHYNRNDHRGEKI